MTGTDRRVGRCVLSASLLAMVVMKLLDAKTEAVVGIAWIWWATIVEAVAGALLLTTWWRSGAWLAGAFALSSLTALGAMRWSGIRVERCGCFGGFQISLPVHVLIAVAMLSVAAGLVIVKEECPPALAAEDSETGRPLHRT